MPFTVKIKNNLTGEVRDLHEDGEYDEGTEFIWNEGNYSCDCNRALLFSRANKEPEDWDQPCGEDKFSIEVIKQ